jgi:hypothetical protein
MWGGSGSGWEGCVRISKTELVRLSILALRTQFQVIFDPVLGPVPYVNEACCR